MKNKINNAPGWAFMAAFFYLLIASLSLNAQLPHRTLNVYSNENEIKATGSVTLVDGFYIPAGKNVRIFTGASFKQCVPFAGAPSANQNYVATRVFKMDKVNAANIDSARSACEVNQTIQYIDGLGRPLQTVTTQGSPGFQDIVQPIAYDAFGREQFKYLPYAETPGQNGSFRPSALTAQTSFFNSPVAGVTAIPNTAFSETRFEASPLNRVLEQGSPGASWQLGNGHTQKLEYGSNIAGDVKLWRIVPGGATGTDTYAVGRLYKTTSKDENWKAADGKAGTIDEYKDLEGHVILKRVWETDTKSLATYYVYDDFGNLSYVLPPAVNQNGQSPISSFTETDPVFRQFIYGYHYDGRKRLIEKKIPGKDWEYLVYNKLDQLVLSQDSVQRVANQWLFSKYDALGRVVVTGLYSDGASRSSLAATLNNESLIWENKISTGIGYDGFSFPQQNISYYHTINCYDDYDFPGNTFGQPDANLGQVTAARTKGLQTGGFIYLINSSTRYLSVNYYDEEGRVIRTASENHLGGKDITDNTWNFAGELTGSQRTHTGSATGSATTIANRYEYDHMGRKIATMESINGQPEVVLSKLDYNEIGQLKTKWLHSTDGNTFLQHTNYAYNERGWLKRSISDEFSLKLGYDTLSNPQYNGNIAMQEWGKAYNFPSIYNYGYDKLNRLQSGISTGAVSMSELLSYDEMGNIKTLKRGDADAGTYFYEGNRLKRIDGGGLAAGSYAYDGNGNATADGRTGVSLTYNYLNLPIGVSKTGLNIVYTYNAVGTKLKKVSDMEAASDYVNGIQYTGGVIDFIITEEGKAKRNNSTPDTYSYYYDLKDHLGNSRYTFNQHPTTLQLQMLQENNYYAFGKQVGGTAINKYLYNGKELQEELGQLDYGARFYDPLIGRWNVIDRLSEFHFETNQYNYVLNNPLIYIDPYGLDTVKVQDLTPEKWHKHGTNDVVALEQVSITPNSQDQSSLVLALIGAGIVGGEKMMHNKETWYSLSKMQNYSQRYLGNQYQSAEMIAKSKGLAKMASTGFKIAGLGIGVYNFYNINKDFITNKKQYNGRPMSQQGLVMENISNSISTFGGGPGVAWGVGWEIGRQIASDQDYRKNVRPVLQDFLGVERDEYNRGYKIMELLENQK